jgi:hypothetical protein
VPAPWERASLRALGTSGQIRISPPRVAKGPSVDGVLDDEVWAMAAVLDSFTHSRPVEGVRDTLGTLAMVLYDDQNLYIAFHARDNPRDVQAPVVPRDQVWQGDWVGVSIDTYNDQQKSFFLCSKRARQRHGARLPVHLARAHDRGRLRRRDGDPVQDPALRPRRERDVRLPGDPRHPPHRRPPLLGAGVAQHQQLPLADRLAAGPVGHPARAQRRDQPHPHHHHARRTPPRHDDVRRAAASASAPRSDSPAT